MINWKIRFNRKNKTFMARFVLAVILPVFACLGVKFEDLTSWGALGKLLVDFISSPYLIGLAIWNALNTLPDPTTKGLRDSRRAMTYDEPH